MSAAIALTDAADSQRAPRRGWLLACLLVVTFGCWGCSTAHYAVNPALATAQTRTAYTIRNLDASGNSDSLTVVLALSGGGYRAAALSYAVMEVMRDTPIHWMGREVSLLQELDFMSAVSGGSLVAATYAQDPDRFFVDFPARVLDFDLQSALWARVLSPSGLWRQGSPTYGRGDLLQELLDEHIFQGRTFASLPRRRPLVYVNATDMRFGDRFEFSHEQFSQLCSDLDRVPLARAVAASMAVPVVLSPITLWNHKHRCPVEIASVPLAGSAAHGPYIHLVDGGLSDNTGIRAALDNIAVRGGLVRSGRINGFTGVRKRVFIIVNAQANPVQPEDDSPNTPGLLRQLRSAVDVPIDRYSRSSLAQLGQAVVQWREELQAVQADTDPAPSAPPVDSADFHVIELNVMTAPHSPEAEAVKAIPTGLRISREQVALIRRFVRRELAANAQWQRLMESLSTAPALKAGHDLPAGESQDPP
jgi:NTE family protein